MYRSSYTSTDGMQYETVCSTGMNYSSHHPLFSVSLAYPPPTKCNWDGCLTIDLNHIPNSITFATIGRSTTSTLGDMNSKSVV